MVRYAGRIQLIVVDEANGIYDMVRADQPSVVGTPLNAALFNSIAADLANIAPPIVGDAENVANSKNVAFYPSLGSIGLVSESSTTTNSFITSVLPINSGLLCAVVPDDTIVLSDLPATQGTLFLMKGDSTDNRGGLFCAKTGGLYYYAVNKWEQLALSDENANYMPVPSSAAVGQFIRVRAVDEQGRVTATEAVTIRVYAGETEELA